MKQCDKGDPMPQQYRHIRSSERKVKPVYYRTCAALSGQGLSIPESQKSINVVSNMMFGRKFKAAEESQGEFDCDTAPAARNVRTALQLQGVEGLSMALDKVQEGKQQGRAVTHDGDSTTKKGAGQFIVQGLNVGQETRFDLPILPVFGETTEDIALQCDMALEILAQTQYRKLIKGNPILCIEQL